MKREDKELLLKDLCARLPYKVNVEIKYSKENGSSLRLAVCSEGMLPLNTDLLGLFQEEEIYLKPYLHSMSSMTEWEQKEWEKTFDSVYDLIPGGDPNDENDYDDNWHNEPSIETFDWLNAHHFDYRGLIKKGLALEAPEGMYNIK